MPAAIKYPLEIQGLPADRIIRPDGPRSKWIRVVTECKEYNEKNNIAAVHHFATVINAKTKDIYRNEQKHVIAIKLFGLSIWTPMVLVARTIYHILFPVSIPHQIYETVKEIKKQEAKAVERGEKPKAPELAKKVIKAIANNFLDIIKTPLYAVIMTVVAIGGLILSALKSDFLYGARQIYGKMLTNLNHGNRDSFWTYAPCMQTIGNLNEIGERRKYNRSNIVYDGPAGSTIHGLNNLAYNYQSLIVHEDDCCFKDWLVQYQKAQKGHRLEKCWL